MYIYTIWLQVPGFPAQMDMSHDRAGDTTDAFVRGGRLHRSSTHLFMKDIKDSIKVGIRDSLREGRIRTSIRGNLGLSKQRNKSWQGEGV